MIVSGYPRVQFWVGAVALCLFAMYLPHGQSTLVLGGLVSIFLVCWMDLLVARQDWLLRLPAVVVTAAVLAFPPVGGTGAVAALLLLKAAFLFLSWRVLGFHRSKLTGASDN